MKILFLGDVVGSSGCSALIQNLPNQIKNKNIDFVIVNGENAADQGVGLTEKICNDLFNCGVHVITTGNHVWDQKEIYQYIENEKRLLRPQNYPEGTPGAGIGQYTDLSGRKILVLHFMGSLFMPPIGDPFAGVKLALVNRKLRRDFAAIFLDFHGEITSEKMAMGHFLDGKATLVVGTHTHVPTNDARILEKGTAYLTDAGMCGDYNSVIGMDKNNSLNKFLKKESKKHFPATGAATLSGVIVEADVENGLAKNIENFIYGGDLKNSH